MDFQTQILRQLIGENITMQVKGHRFVVDESLSIPRRIIFISGSIIPRLERLLQIEPIKNIILVTFASK